MSGIKTTKPFPTLNNIHVNDENNIVEFLNSTSTTIISSCITILTSSGTATF